MVNARILGTGRALPAARRSTRELLEIAMPGRDAGALQQRIGIDSRRWVGAGENAASLAVGALREALASAQLEAGAMRRLILVTSTSGDRLSPATSNAVVRALGIVDDCGCVDLNNACTGFVSALDLAARLVHTGEGPVGVVAVETLSRHLHPSNPRPYVVMGDAAGAVIVGAGGADEGLLASDFGNDGTRQAAVTLDQAGLSGVPEWVTFGFSAREIGASAIGDLQRSVDRALRKADVARADVAWWLLHQPNGGMLDAFADVLGLRAEQLVPVVDYIGSVASASVPFSLDVLWRSGRIQPGQTLMFAAVGGGASRGAVLWRMGA